MSPDDALDPAFEALLLFLRDSRGVDFTGYKRASLRRLVARRMTTAGAVDLGGYLDQLQVDPAEVRALFDSLLINVTGFFRDPSAWASLRALLPDQLAALGPDEPVRVWSAACATGQEAYTLAVLLHEALGDEDYRRRVKVYATDVDELALATARAGRFDRRSLEGLTDDQVERYFPGSGDDEARTFRADLRPALIFGRHDLLADAPISRVSLLVCRNVLMYFTAETQTRILERFAFALQPSGLLLLGRAEMLLTHTDLFTPVDLPHRIFRGAADRTPRRLLVASGQGARAAAISDVSEAAFRLGPDPQVVLDAHGLVALLNDSAAELGLTTRDVGRHVLDTAVVLALPELRAVVARVQADNTPHDLRDVRWEVPGEPERYWDVQVAPLPGRGAVLGVQIAFLDVTRHHALTRALQEAHGELQSAYEELQSSTEELETTNEELQSAIEELETTNEELQSTNEELETMNEELQSTNEELQTVNDELRERTTEVGEVNAFLESVLAGLNTAVAVVDRDLKVIVWNARAEHLWGLRAFEVEGERLALLPGQLPVEAMVGVVRTVLRGPGTQDLTDAGTTTVETDRFGTKVLLTLSGSPLLGREGQIRGVVLTMEHHGLGDPAAG